MCLIVNGTHGAPLPMVRTVPVHYIMYVQCCVCVSFSLSSAPRSIVCLMSNMGAPVRLVMFSDVMNGLLKSFHFPPNLMLTLLGAGLLAFGESRATRLLPCPSNGESPVTGVLGLSLSTSLCVWCRSDCQYPLLINCLVPMDCLL